MRKQEFLDKLKASLWAMPEADKQRSMDYYAEMIDDHMEDGLSEEEAVAAIGDLDEIVKQILTESPRPPQVVRPAQKQQTGRDNTKIWLIVLLIVGSPVWIPLVASVIGTVFGVYVSLWSMVIAFYATTFALAVSALGCVVGSFFMLGSMAKVIVTWGAALLCAGLAILFLLLSNLAAKGMVKLTKWAWNTCKGMVQRKERAV